MSMRKDLLRALVLGLMFGVAGCGPKESALPDTGSGGSTTKGTGGNGGGSGGMGAAGHTGGTGGISATGGAGGGTGGLTGGTGGAGGSGSGDGGHTGVSTGGTSATGGSPGSGGRSSSGGADGGSDAGTRDASADDTAAPACPPGNHTTTGTQYCQAPSSGLSGNVGNTGYSYNLWSDEKGSGCMTIFNVGATFKASWTNVGDWIARVGLSFDKTKTPDQIGTFSSDFAYTTTGITTGGFGNVGIYGWSVNPLHEYYIAENWLGKRPNFTKVETFTIDGEGTYDVMTNMQTNQPNITGTNASFVQFWSVRQTPRECGHISISKHFAEWARVGMQLGNLEETRILVEAQNNSGTIDFTTATVVVTK
jgi:hypothetical protein